MGVGYRRACHQDFPRRADPVASDPTSRDVQLLRTTKQNKGARRGRSHYAFQSPRAPEPAPSRGSSPGPPAGGGPRPGWVAPWSLVSPRLPVTGAEEAAVGQPKRWENQMVLNLLLPPPPPPTHPPNHPSIHPIPSLSLQARGLAAFRRDLAGITPGKGLPLSKGHHPERGARVGPGASHSKPHGVGSSGAAPNPRR